MSEIKITKDSLENAVLRDGQFVSGYVVGTSYISADGHGAHAEGYADGPNMIIASGQGAHAEGFGSQAKGIAAHAEGWSHVNGVCAHGEGYGTEVQNGYGAHAEGYETLASGDGAHAGGEGTIANQDAMTAIGKYNVSTNTANTLFVVGDGTSSADADRSDAFRVVSGGLSTASPIPSSVQAKVNGVSDVYLGCPIGTIVMWAGENAPEGWHICDGSGIPTKSNYSEVEIEIWKDYSNLLKVLAESGYPYGHESGTYTRIDGSTTGGPHVNLPNFNGLFPVGVGEGTDTNGKTYEFTLGSYTPRSGYGEYSHTLTINEMPSHSHSVLHGASGSYSVNGLSFVGQSPGYEGGSTGMPIVQKTGGDSPHNNTPPYIAINFIIKYK